MSYKEVVGAFGEGVWRSNGLDIIYLVNLISTFMSLKQSRIFQVKSNELRFTYHVG